MNNKRELTKLQDRELKQCPCVCNSADNKWDQAYLPQVLLPDHGSCIGELRDLYSRRTSMASNIAAIERYAS